VALSTRSRVGTATIEQICSLPDDLYRVRWVEFAYYDLSDQLRPVLGGNASWCTFARWSTYTIGEALRLDQPNARLEAILREDWVKPFASVLKNIEHRLRNVDRGAIPILLAAGNRLVFHEIGYAVTAFLEWLRGRRDAGRDGTVFDADAWAAYRATIQCWPANDFFRACDANMLRDALEAYYRASCASADPVLQAQLVLLGNLLLGAYEQWRVDAYLEVALDLKPSGLVQPMRIDPHDEAGHDHAQPFALLRAGTPFALRHLSPVTAFLSDRYAWFLTRFSMTWDAPLTTDVPESRILGRDVGPLTPDGELWPPALRNLDRVPVAGKLFDSYDRSHGTGKGTAASNWRRFTDRMDFIANLFRKEQQNEHLFAPPTHEQLRFLDLQLTDEALDEMRGHGDPPMDTVVAELFRDPNMTPRDFVTGFMAHRLDYEPLDGLPRPDPPAWASGPTIKAGQDFFARYGLEIASALFSASLPKAYTAAHGARVLMASAELVSNPSRRIAETGQFLLDLMVQDEPPLARDTTGYRAARGVRLFHAAIRHLVLTHTDADHRDPADGVPVNQEDLLGTLVTFTVIVMEALDNMGIVVSDAERDAYLHLWLVAGHLLGIDYALLRPAPLGPAEPPLDYLEMQAIRTSVFRRQAAPSIQGQLLTRALLDESERSIGPWLRSFPAASTRRLLGEYPADMLEVPFAGATRLVLEGLRPVARLVDPITHGRLFRYVSRQTTRGMYQRWIEQATKGQRPPWRNQEFLSKWGVRAASLDLTHQPSANGDRSPQPTPAAGTAPRIP
jgi:ER-bound oxygenase mpaB/B'/Rubber oxygenase, catalytic domain